MGLFPVGGFPTSTAGSTIATSAASSPAPVSAQRLLSPNAAAPAATATSVPYGDLMMYMLQSLVQMVCALLGHPAQALSASPQNAAKPASASNTPGLPAASKSAVSNDVSPYSSALPTTASAALSSPPALPSSVQSLAPAPLPAPTPATPATVLSKDATTFYSPVLTPATPPPPPPVAADTGVYKPLTTPPPPTASADTTGVYQPIPMDLASYPFTTSVNEGMVTSLPAPDLTPADTVIYPYPQVTTPPPPPPVAADTGVYKPLTTPPPPTASADTTTGVYQAVPMDLASYPFTTSVNEGMVTSLPSPDLTPADTVIYPYPQVTTPPPPPVAADTGVYKPLATPPPPTASADTAAGVYQTVPMDLASYPFTPSVNEGMVTSLPSPDLTPADTVIYPYPQVTTPPPPPVAADTGVYKPLATPPTASADTAAGVYQAVPMDLASYPFTPSVNEGMVTSLPSPDLTPADTVIYPYPQVTTPPPPPVAADTGVYKPLETPPPPPVAADTTYAPLASTPPAQDTRAYYQTSA